MDKRRPADEFGDLVAALLIVATVFAVGLMTAFFGIKFLPFAILVFGVAAAGYGIFRLYAGWRTKRWKPVNGTLIDLAVIEKRVSVGYAGTVVRFVPRATYSYIVREREYVSNRIALDEKSIWRSSQHDAEKQLKPLVGKRGALSVFYCERNPESSVIMAGYSIPRWSHYWALTMLGLFVAAAAIVLF